MTAFCYNKSVHIIEGFMLRPALKKQIAYMRYMRDFLTK